MKRTTLGNGQAGRPALLFPEKLCIRTPDVIRIQDRGILQLATLHSAVRDSCYCSRQRARGRGPRAAQGCVERSEILSDEFHWTGGQRFQPLRRSEEHTSELQSQSNLVCRLLLEKKKKKKK